MAFLYVLDAAAGPIRDGRKLVIPRFGKSLAGVTLPSVCVKCGSPATRSVYKTFYWHSPVVYFYLLALFPVGYLIASRMVRKGIELSVPFCQAHSMRRRNFLLAAGLLPVAGFILLRFVGLNNNETVAGIKAALFVLICLACVIVAAIFWNPIRPKRIDDVCGVFTGCSEEFLRDLPVYKLPASVVQALPTQQRSLRDLQGRAAPPPPPPIQ